MNQHLNRDTRIALHSLARVVMGEEEQQWKWGVPTVVLLAVFILVVDTTMMNVAINDLVVDLNTTVGTIQSIIAIYALIMASFMLLGARMGDVFGRRRAFVVALIIYTVGTTIAALSTTAGMLFFGWSFLEGVGADVMLPATLAIINMEYKGKDKALAHGAGAPWPPRAPPFAPSLVASSPPSSHGATPSVWKRASPSCSC